MTTTEFLNLVSWGFNTPRFVVNPHKNFGSRLTATLKEYFDPDKRFNLLVSKTSKQGKWIEGLSFQDAILQDVFLETNRHEVIITEGAKLEWGMDVLLRRDFSGSYTWGPEDGSTSESHAFVNLEFIPDIQKKSICRNLLGLWQFSPSWCNEISVSLGWAEGFFGTKGERLFVFDYEFLV